MTPLLALMCCLNGAFLEVQVLPWRPEISTCFVADANQDMRAEVCVLEGNRLRIHRRGQLNPVFDIALPQGTAAIDIADLDSDGTADLVAVHGDDILAYRLERMDGGPPSTVFSLKNQYSRTTGRPFPSTLVVDSEVGPTIVLPRDEALEVRDLTGKLLESYPVSGSPYHLSISRPFSYWVNQNAQSGPATALEFRISSLVGYMTAPSEETGPLDVAAPAARLGTPRQQREARGLDAPHWPWFLVGSEGGAEYRALYRTAVSAVDATEICIRKAPADAGSDTGGAVSIGPARVYPGSLLLDVESTPDFDGDGFTDIILWKSRQPAITPDGLARAANRGAWPLSITTHTYLPEKLRYAPRPHSHVEIQIPLAWWLSTSNQGPLREVILRDFDGDGMTDLGCLTSEDTLVVWRSRVEGFEPEPVFQHRFPEPAGRLLFQSDLEGLGCTTVGMACGNELHILRPNSPASDL